MKIKGKFFSYHQCIFGISVRPTDAITNEGTFKSNELKSLISNDEKNVGFRDHIEPKWCECTQITA